MWGRSEEQSASWMGQIKVYSLDADPNSLSNCHSQADSCDVYTPENTHKL